MGSCSANTWFFTEWSGQVNHSVESLDGSVSIVDFAVLGRVRNGHPDAAGPLLGSQRRGLRRGKEAGHVADVRLGQGLRRQVVRRAVESGARRDERPLNETLLFIYKRSFFFSVLGHVRRGQPDARGDLSGVRPRPVPRRAGHAVLGARQARRRGAVQPGQVPGAVVHERVVRGSISHYNFHQRKSLVFFRDSARQRAEREPRGAKSSASTRTNSRRRIAATRIGRLCDTPATCDPAVKVLHLTKHSLQLKLVQISEIHQRYSAIWRRNVKVSPLSLVQLCT